MTTNMNTLPVAAAANTNQAPVVLLPSGRSMTLKQVLDVMQEVITCNALMLIYHYNIMDCWKDTTKQPHNISSDKLMLWSFNLPENCEGKVIFLHSRVTAIGATLLKQREE